ncbi:TrbI/VirB10 family protein (plasmid) [Klebsiella pneumoniae]|uniref:Type IV secretory pathway, VirB10 components n=3 Tax=Gammaproteobacteria TaxID=1236 RepID=A0A0U2PYT9_CITFR|nr:MULTISPECIES: TrbI/VirB10 family protein [Enterobacteriaceae]ECZ7285869.1 TrbI/VirB10 family protein [Salmonella enterica]EEB6041916.1 conjugal transfer protein TrbI [Salmonella enterica subsp. enterica serovar Muenchen]EGE4882508.1 TrbI/VirB10 family protein [Salmonella enterica subsp. enterica serovar Gaminara]HBQ5886579.1 TrbI/VirB10 family protein [Klebsiella variicola subsp. variicola]ALT06314.1 Type IV secretory pathway, VirB10 components [Citrobacter freundii]
MEERQNRVDEKPATYKKKGQMYLLILIGVIALLLTINMFYSLSQKKDDTEGNKQDKPAATQGDTANNDPDRFKSLLDARQKELDKKASAPAAKSPYDGVKLPSKAAQSEGTDGGADGESSQGSGGGKDLVSEAKRRFEAEEVLRALKARQTRYSDTGSAVGSSSSVSPYSAPGASSGSSRSLRGNKDDNASRIAQIDQVQSQLQSRIKMMEAQAANGDEEARQNLAAARRDVDAQRAEAGAGGSSSAANGGSGMRGDFGGTQGGATVPEDIVGYSADNEYKASTEGKVKLPVGAEINAITTYTAISDYTGGTMKAMVTNDIYDATKSYILAPKGSQLLIKVVKASNVNEMLQNRLAFTVRWLVLPDGKRIDFRKASVLDRMGTPAVEADEVDYHVTAQILGVTAYALIGTKTSYEGTGDGNESFAGNFGEGARQQSNSIAQKYLQVVPTATIHAGAPIRIITEDEMFIKPWKMLYESYVN